MVTTLRIGRSGFDYGAVMIFHHSVLASCGSNPSTYPMASSGISLRIQQQWCEAAR